MSLDNGAIAELLGRESEQAEGILKRAFKRAARAAFLWPVEATTLAQSGRSLTELHGIGPHLQRVLSEWIEHPPNHIEPPPLRKGFLTLSKARNVLARHPEWRSNYQGDLQMHSKWSDGSATIRQMAEAARQLGHKYIAITDHSQGLKIAGGMSEAELVRQKAKIKDLNRQHQSNGNDFRVLSSIELNLSPDGTGDMSDSALEDLDLVVGSFHSKLREKSDQTERFLAALENRHLTILGHPVGRIYNHRLGLVADWKQVCARAAELDKALEVDSYPDRQDLCVEKLRIASAAGTRIAVDTDAHAPEQLAFVELGLAAALMAGVRPERIVNFMPAHKLLKWAKSTAAR